MSLFFFFWPSFIPLQLHLQNSSHPVRGQKWTEVDSSSSLRQLQQRTCTSLLTSVLFRGISMQHRPPAAPRHHRHHTAPGTRQEAPIPSLRSRSGRPHHCATSGGCCGAGSPAEQLVLSWKFSGSALAEQQSTQAPVWLPSVCMALSMT